MLLRRTRFEASDVYGYNSDVGGSGTLNTEPLQKTDRLSDRISLLLVVAVCFLALVPMYIWGIPLGADLDAHFRFVQPFYDEVAGGDRWPGWLAESNNGFGDARFRFYPPLMFWVMSAGRWLAGDWYTGYLLAFSLFSIVGCLGVYFWAREYTSSRIAVLAAAIFAFMPYHVTQFYQASLLLEFSASAFLPFCFLFLDRLMRKRGLTAWNIAGLAVSFSLVVYTHVPTTIIAGISLGLFALLSTDWRHHKRGLLFALMAMILALVLSSPFWYTVVTELEWVNAGHKVTSEHYIYTNNFLFSPFTPPGLNTWFGGLVAALTIGLAFPAIFVRPDRATIGCSPGVSNFGPAAIVAVFAFLMTTELSRPIWAIVPKLADIQFPFRWLSIPTVVLCPLIAVSVCHWAGRIKHKQFAAWHLPIVLIFAISLGYTIYELVIKSDFLDREAFAARIEQTRRGPSFSDWLPVGAAELKDLKPMAGPIDAGTREVISADVQSHRRRFHLAAGEPTDVRIRTYYYPLWRASITTPLGTRPAQTKMAQDGTLLVEVPAENCEISIVFAD